jgi:tetratricopeptide (TPR) repeat protein
MLTIIPLAVIIISFAIILVIASKHLKKAATLDVSEIPEERDAVLKTSLLENRLLRKVDYIFRLFAKIVNPSNTLVGKWFNKGIKRIKFLEKTYKFQGLPDTSKKVHGKAKQLLFEAHEEKKAGNLNQAESKYLSAIKVDLKSSDAYLGLGEVYINMKEWQQALETFEYMVSHWPQEDKGYAFLAIVEVERGNFKEAKDHYLHALSINNEVVEYHMGLSELYVRLDDKEKALSSLQKAQGLEPNNPKILDKLLSVSTILKDKELAEEVLEKIKKVNPDHGKINEFEKKVKKLK